MVEFQDVLFEDPLVFFGMRRLVNHRAIFPNFKNAWFNTTDNLKVSLADLELYLNNTILIIN